MTPEETRIVLQTRIQAFIDDVEVDPGVNWLTEVNAALDEVYDGPGSIPVGPPPQ